MGAPERHPKAKQVGVVVRVKNRVGAALISLGRRLAASAVPDAPVVSRPVRRP